MGDINGDGWPDAVVIPEKRIYTNSREPDFNLEISAALPGMAEDALALGHFTSKGLNHNNPSSSKCREADSTKDIEITLDDGTVKKGLCPKVH